MISRPLKIYFLPFFAQGHLIPLVHLARLVASRGQHVTIITTPSNAQLFDKTIDNDTAAGHHIHVHTLNFPSKEVGLLPGIENFAGSDNSTAGKLYVAARLIQPAVESLLSQSPPPDVFIADIMFTWSEASSKRLKLPRIVFNPTSIFNVCMIEAIKSHPEAFESSDSGPYNILGLPHTLTLPIKPPQIFSHIHGVNRRRREGQPRRHRQQLQGARRFVEYTQHYENLTGRKVWHIGPTSLMEHKTALPTSSVGAENDHECLK